MKKIRISFVLLVSLLVLISAIALNPDEQQSLSDLGVTASNEGVTLTGKDLFLDGGSLEIVGNSYSGTITAGSEGGTIDINGKQIVLNEESIVIIENGEVSKFKNVESFKVGKGIVYEGSGTLTKDGRIIVGEGGLVIILYDGAIPITLERGSIAKIIRSQGRNIITVSGVFTIDKLGTYEGKNVIIYPEISEFNRCGAAPKISCMAFVVEDGVINGYIYGKSSSSQILITDTCDECKITFINENVDLTPEEKFWVDWVPFGPDVEQIETGAVIASNSFFKRCKGKGVECPGAIAGGLFDTVVNSKPFGG